MAIRKLQYGYPYEGQEREEKRENQSPQGLEAVPLRPQVQQTPENKSIKIQNRIRRLIFDKAVVCPGFEREDQRIGPVRLSFQINEELPISFWAEERGGHFSRNSPPQPFKELA